MKELKAENLEDIIAGISLYRPGPMDFIPRYLKGKNERTSITYECPQLEPILAPTYGCIVYQEQVMQIVRELAGYTLGPVSYTHLGVMLERDSISRIEGGERFVADYELRVFAKVLGDVYKRQGYGASWIF